MTFESSRLNTDDDTALATYRWPSNGRCRAIVLIVHGMAEHALRYDAFAEHLANAGYDVHALDLRGHGATSRAVDHGLIEARPLWPALLDDISRLRRHALDIAGERPVFILGHSLGSFLTQATVERAGERYAGAILCGTERPSRPMYYAFAALARIEALRKGPRGTSRLLQHLSVDGFSRDLKRRNGGIETDSDWLSADREVVRRYIDDPDCGFALRTRTWAGVMAGIAATHNPHRRRAIPVDLPVLLVAGAEDPVGRFGRGPDALARALVNDGQQHVEIRLYEGARHELLNERAMLTVTRDILQWMDTTLTTLRSRRYNPEHPACDIS